MKQSMKMGFCFGITSGVITTLGLIVGLHAGTNSKLVILGGILTIAVADAFSDALGIHISEEFEGRHTAREIWESTFFTFLSKFVFALVFMIPILIFELSTAIWMSVIFGLTIVGILSFVLAKEQKTNPWIIIVEHLIIALAVIFVTHYVGDFISFAFS